MYMWGWNFLPSEYALRGARYMSEKCEKSKNEKKRRYKAY